MVHAVNYKLDTLIYKYIMNIVMKCWLAQMIISTRTSSSKSDQCARKLAVNFETLIKVTDEIEHEDDM